MQNSSTADIARAWEAGNRHLIRAAPTISGRVRFAGAPTGVAVEGQP